MGEQEKPRFPLVEITGGPHGKNTKVAIDGEEVRGITGLSFRVGVNDVAKLQLDQIVQLAVRYETADIEVPEPAYVASVYRREIVDSKLDPEGGIIQSVKIAEGHGATEGDALRAAADEIDPPEVPPSPFELLRRGLRRIAGGSAIVPW